MSRIEFIYFDLGNVLVSFDHAKACHQIAGLAGISLERAERIIFQSGLQTRYEEGEITTEEFRRYFCDQANAEVSLEALCFAASNIFEPMENSIQLLQTLYRAGLRLGLLSNTCDCHWKFLLDDGRFSFLHSSFEQTVLSFIAGHVKPGIDIYRVAASQANCAPETILFIDDKQENVSGARSYGFDTIHYQGTRSLMNALISRNLGSF